MEPNKQAEPTFEEGVAEVISALPAPVQAYLAQEKYVQVVTDLGQKYQLHIDQMATLQQELLLFLIGTKSPVEFASSIQTKTSLPMDVVKQIVVDLNQQVFLPLQNQMKGTTGEAAIPTNAKTAPPPANLPGVIKPEMLLEDHEEPTITFNVPAAPRPTMPSAPIMPKPVMPLMPPAPSATTAPRPVAPPTFVPPPGAMGAPSVAAAPASAPLQAPKPPVASASAPAPKPIVKEYSVDPYREPLEGE